MSTDTTTRRDPWPVLLAALLTADPGASWSSRDWHEQATLAGLRSAQVGAAQRAAVEAGYLEPVGEWVDGEWSPNMLRSTHDGGKGRWVSRYRRTSLPLPGQTFGPQVPGQLDLLEVGT